MKEVDQFEINVKRAGKMPALQRTRLESKAPAGGQRYEAQATRRCVDGAQLLLASAGTACRAPTAEKARAKRTMSWRAARIG